jgi:hydrogenase maturation protease
VSRLCILGIGSPSGDDQVGWMVVDALLAREVKAGGEIVIDKLDRPGATLLTLIEQADWAILIDAMQGNGQPGTIRRFDRQDWAAYRGGLSSHGFGVLDALMLGGELGSLPPRLDLYGIEIGEAASGEESGADVRAAARLLADRIAAELAGIRPG